MAISWSNVVGHKRVTETLDSGIATGKLGHAYLFSGEKGVGKFPLALNFAMALLCESDNKPCGECISCKRVMSHSHPDFRYIFPITFETTHKVKGGAGRLTDLGWEFAYNSIKSKIAKPYSINNSYDANVPVDWIREVNSAINGSTSKKMVVIIEGIENYRKEAANAMLKTIEEPPEGTVMILLARSIHGVIPTIKSRCQIHRFGLVSNEEIIVFLTSRFNNITTSDISKIAIKAEGSPGKALELTSNHLSTKDNELPSLLDFIKRPLSSSEQSLEIEDFVEEIKSLDGIDRGGDLDMKNSNSTYDIAAIIVRDFIEDLREIFLKPFNISAECILDGSTDSIIAISEKDAEFLINAAEGALLSIRRHSPLLMVFVQLILRISEKIDVK